MKKGQNSKYEKSYFQGANPADRDFLAFMKQPSRHHSKNIARQSKKKKK